MVQYSISVLFDLLKGHLRGTNPTKIAIAGFAVLVFTGLLITSRLFGLSVNNFVAIVLPSLLATIKIHEFVEDINNNPIDNGNEQFKEYAKMLEELQSDLTDYERVTRVLESRDITLDAILEHTTGSRGIWIAFGDQTLDSRDAPDDESIDKGNWVRHVLERDYDLINITPLTWLIPPAVVENEGLATADSDQLEKWIDKNVFAKFPHSSATISFMAVVDLGRGYINPGGEDAQLTALPLKIIEKADTFTEEDLLDALHKQEVNLLEVVKTGELVFFLPLNETNAVVDAVRDQEEQATEYLNNDSLRGLANENNTDLLAQGLEEIDEVEDSERLANDITQEAQRWKRVLE